MSKTTTNLQIILFVLVFFFGAASACLGQIVQKYNNCEDNEAIMNVSSGYRREGTKLIVIGRRGNGEKSDRYTHRRLATLRQYLRGGGIESSAVFSLGERSSGKPQIEIYINGKLEIIFETPNTGRLKVGNCGN